MIKIIPDKQNDSLSDEQNTSTTIDEQMLNVKKNRSTSTSSNKGPELKTFRISSNSGATTPSTGAKELTRKQSFVFNVFSSPLQPTPVKAEQVLPQTKHKGLGFDIVKVTNEPVKETGSPGPELPSPLVASPKRQEKIDYGDDDDDYGKQENIQIRYDDEFENMEDKIRAEHRDKPGFGSRMEINYGDEDEFPQDESHINVTFQ